MALGVIRKNADFIQSDRYLFPEKLISIRASICQGMVTPAGSRLHMAINLRLTSSVSFIRLEHRSVGPI